MRRNKPGGGPALPLSGRFLSPAAILLLWLACAFLLSMRNVSCVSAASWPASITSCALTGREKVVLKAELRGNEELAGKKCFVFALPAGRTRILSEDRPAASGRLSSRMTFRFSLKRATASSRLWSLFVLAVRQEEGGGYERISNLRLISNPQSLARYSYKFPTPASKKGLQVNGQMPEDAAELNVRHAAINIVFTEMAASAAEQNERVSYSWSWHGRTYWFRKAVINSYDRQLRALKETDSVNSAILLLGWRDDLAWLIYPSGREQGHSFYAWDTRSPAAREFFQAALSFLAGRYSAKNGSNGRIVNWVIGNEVNNYRVYNYAGNLSLPAYARVYAQAFRLASQTLTSVYANARVYISLDHLWNYNKVAGAFPSRKMMKAFADQLSRYGGVHWNLAFHPYSSPPTEPRFWENANGWALPSVLTPVITMKNLTVLTDYVRRHYGRDTRIILSEQGYTSRKDGKKAEKDQAAAIVLSYYLAESNDMVDSFIMNRHVDHPVEIRQGLSLGLWTTGSRNAENAGRKKYSWSVFKYMDSSRSPKVSRFALRRIGIKSWKDLVPDYSEPLYNTYGAETGSLKAVKSHKGKKALPARWVPYGAVRSVHRQGRTITVLRQGSRNRNALWGLTQSLNRLSFSKTPVLYFRARVSGSTNGKALLKLRIFSAANVLEAEKVISTGKEALLGISLKKWSLRGKVTRIQFLVAPFEKGSWTSEASFTLRDAARG